MIFLGKQIELLLRKIEHFHLIFFAGKKVDS